MKVKKNIPVIVLLLALSGIWNNLTAQIEEPVKWETKIEKIDENYIYLILNAEINDGWDMYSQFFEEGGPLHLRFDFEESGKYELIGIVEEIIEPSEKFDEIFKVNIRYFTEKAEFKQKIRLKTNDGFNLTGAVAGQVCYVDGRCINIGHDFNIPIGGGEKTEEEHEYLSEKESQKMTPVIVTDNPYESMQEHDSIISFLLIAFLFGILAILTPCVFPMIPMTVSFFIKKSSSKLNSIIKALIFGISIVILYTLVGVIISLTSAGADFTTVLSTSWIPNLIFFVLFIVFAASLFGLFEFVLPSSLINKADKQVDKGGMIASFFLALTLVIVSFSCTGPIIGALLVQATTGSILQPSIGMFGFGLGFALPFTILAISPNRLNKLPKSGGWLNSVKIVMGFLILAFSLKFLSNIDQNYHLNILSRDIYIAIWAVIFILLGLYLLGKIKFPHDTQVKKTGFFRLIPVIISFLIAVYLIPGIFGANLSTISGLLPPMTAQKINLFAGKSETAASTLCDEPKYADRLFLPYNINAYFDYKQGIECAKSQNKPVLLYFTGHSCSNCKKMQGEIWSDKRVQEYFNNEFILIALYVDDRVIELDEEDRFVSKNDGKIKKRLGEANADIQVVNFNNNSQPYYATISTEGKALAKPMTYNNNTEAFIEFLEKSIENFEITCR